MVIFKSVYKYLILSRNLSKLAELIKLISTVRELLNLNFFVSKKKPVIAAQDNLKCGLLNKVSRSPSHKSLFSLIFQNFISNSTISARGSLRLSCMSEFGLS